MLNSIYRVFARELKRITGKRSYYFLYIGIPVLTFLVFSFIYKNETLTELPAAVVDLDRSTLSETLTGWLDASPSMEITKELYSLEEVKEEFRKGNIHAAIYIPRNMEKDIKGGRQATVTFYRNSTNIVIGNTLLKDGLKVIKTISGGALLKKLRSAGLPEGAAYSVVSSVNMETVSLGNPGYSYQQYLMPGLAAFTLQMVIMLGGVLIISSETSEGTFTGLVETAGGSITALVTGKLAAHFLFHIINAALLLGFIFPVFGVNINGGIFAAGAYILLFSLACLTPAFLLSALIPDKVMATEVALFFNTPAFIFSGFTFPLWVSPWVHKVFAEIFPFTHFLNGYLKLAGIGTPVSYLSGEIFVLFLFAVIPVPLAWGVLKLKLKGSIPAGKAVTEGGAL